LRISSNATARIHLVEVDFKGRHDANLFKELIFVGTHVINQLSARVVLLQKVQIMRDEKKTSHGTTTAHAFYGLKPQAVSDTTGCSRPFGREPPTARPQT